MSGQYLNCESKKTFIKVFLFDKFMHSLILASTFFASACISLVYMINLVNLFSKWIPESFWQVSFSISKSLVSIFIFSPELTSKWHLPGLHFLRLLSNQFWADSVWRRFQRFCLVFILSETAYSHNFQFLYYVILL